MKYLHLCIVALILVGLFGCKTTNTTRGNAVVAVGYASISLQSGTTFQQQTLQAITASKLAAYRELTEQIYGQEISGNTNISQMLVQNDTLRGRVEGLIRGAEVVASYPQGGYLCDGAAPGSRQVGNDRRETPRDHYNGCPGDPRTNRFLVVCMPCKQQRPLMRPLLFLYY